MLKKNNLKQKVPRLDLLLFPSVKSIHKSIKMRLVILKFKDQGQKMPQSNKIDLRIFCKNLPL